MKGETSRNLERARELTRPVDVLSSLLGNEVAVAGAKYDDCMDGKHNILDTAAAHKKTS